MSPLYRGLPESRRSLSVRSAPFSSEDVFREVTGKTQDITREEKKQEETDVDEGPSPGWNEDPTSIEA